MDPVLIDPIPMLGSVAGIVALTIAIVNLLKRSIGDAPALKTVPVWVYAVLVSGGLTWLAHSVLGLLPGEFPLLLTQAVVQVLLASGAIELARTATKPIGETTTAIGVRYEKAVDMRDQDTT